MIDGPTEGAPLLRVSNLSKSFPGVKALQNVSLQVRAGEIVAIVGHNGSGKSTLVKILAGVYEADPGGTVQVRGVDPGHADAEEGLHFIHQDLGLIGMLSSIENLTLGRQGGGGFAPLRGRQEQARAQELIARFEADFDASAPIATLSPAERAIVAIARALDGWTRQDNVLVLDEPTTAFHGQEVEVLFKAVRRVAAAGAGVVFISHRLDEVLGLADRVIALRDGKLVADEPANELDHERIVQLIAGRAVADTTAGRAPESTPVALAVEGLRGEGLESFDLHLREGEIVGVSGILGSGREKLGPLLFGARRRLAGTVEVAGRQLRPNDIPASISAGLALVPADRRAEGAVMDMNARENLVLPLMRPLQRALWRLSAKVEHEETGKWVETVDLRPPDPERELRLFSGGNQQKIVFAKWLRTAPKVLLLDEPTQGVDVGAKDALYRLVGDAAGKGMGVLVCSSDTEELVKLCHRVIVLESGRISTELSGESLTEERLVSAEIGLPAAPDRRADHTDSERTPSDG